MKLLRSLFGLFLVFAILYGGVKILPHYVANFQLESDLDDVARTGATNAKITDDELRQNVIRQAQALGIPLTEEQVLIEHIPGDVFVSGEYTVHVDLLLYPLDLHFHPMSRNKKRLMD
jgi:hypothetical protein